MIAINAHFDGSVIVPDEPIDLPLDEALIVRIEPVQSSAPSAPDSALNWVVENAIDQLDLPSDLSEHHDHYLYGSKKKDE
jgi:hypothetical protein